MIPQPQQLSKMVTMIAEQATSVALMAEFRIDQNTLDWWVVTAKCIKPVDQRRLTADIDQSAIAEMRLWFKEKQATVEEFRARYDFASRFTTLKILAELNLPLNKRRPVAKQAGGKAFAVSVRSRESINNLARSREADRSVASMRTAINEEKARQQSDRLSIVDRNRVLGQTKIDPYD
jgi:hypothetical protein